MADKEDELTRLAIAELTRNAKRGRERSATMGSLAWKSSPVPAANKRFLHNTIIGAMQANKKISTQTPKRINDSKEDVTNKRTKIDKSGEKLKKSKSNAVPPKKKNDKAEKDEP